jgi:hypothetical protein
MEETPNTEAKKNITFEESLPIIDNLLSRNKHKWQLKIISSIDWEDIEQIIRIHLFKKWHLFDSTKQVEPWINTIINNQLRNLKRNVYDSCSRPCLKCVFNTGSDGCDWTVNGKQDSNCPLYKKWENGKKYAHNVKLPVSTENHTNEVMEMPSSHIDSEKYILIFHDEMKKKLKLSMWLIYEALYIKNLSEEQVAKDMGFVSHEKNRKPGYARIQQIKRNIIKIAREVKDKIDFI